MGSHQTQNTETGANPNFNIRRWVIATLEDERWLGIFMIVTSGCAFVGTVV